jgi:hypothetical protein
MGQLDARESRPSIGLEQHSHAGQVMPHGIDEGTREHRHAVLAALALAHHDLVPHQVHILHAQLQALREPQARAVQEPRHERVLARQSAEERAGLVLREHDGQATRALGARDSIQPRHLDSQHLAVEEEEGGERLVLRGRRNMAVVGEGGKERGDVLGSQSRGWRRPWKRM